VTVVLDLKRMGKPIPVNDLWIAALCRQYLLPVVTRDRHFDVVPNLQRLGW
jgi:predicted nucleic acid-binding protein